MPTCLTQPCPGLDQLQYRRPSPWPGLGASPHNMGLLRFVVVRSNVQLLRTCWITAGVKKLLDQQLECPHQWLCLRHSNTSSRILDLMRCFTLFHSICKAWAGHYFNSQVVESQAEKMKMGSLEFLEPVFLHRFGRLMSFDDFWWDSSSYKLNASDLTCNTMQLFQAFLQQEVVAKEVEPTPTPWTSFHHMLDSGFRTSGCSSVPLLPRFAKWHSASFSRHWARATFTSCGLRSDPSERVQTGITRNYL